MEFTWNERVKSVSFWYLRCVSGWCDTKKGIYSFLARRFAPIEKRRKAFRQRFFPRSKVVVDDAYFCAVSMCVGVHSIYYCSCVLYWIDIPFHTPKSCVIGIHKYKLKFQEMLQPSISSLENGWKNSKMPCDNCICDHLRSIFDWTLLLRPSFLSDNFKVVIELSSLYDLFCSETGESILWMETMIWHILFCWNRGNRFGHIKSFIHRNYLVRVNRTNYSNRKCISASIYRVLGSA